MSQTRTQSSRFTHYHPRNLRLNSRKRNQVLSAATAFNLFDTYSLRARVLPALLTALPALVVVLILYPDVYGGYGAAIVSLSVTCGVLFLFSNVIRSRGRRLEKKLIQDWGGLATTRFLRHRDETLDRHTTERYHQFLSSRLPTLRFPTDESERANEAVADECYKSATKWLLEFTRDQSQYPLVFKENVAYGFRRNLLGARPIGITICLLSGALATFQARRVGITQIEEITAPFLVIAIALTLCIATWCLVVTSEFVADASIAYARALLATCDAAVNSAKLSTHSGRIVAH